MVNLSGMEFLFLLIDKIFLIFKDDSSESFRAKKIRNRLVKSAVFKKFLMSICPLYRGKNYIF